MTCLWKDLPGKIQHKVSENWLNAILLLTPLVATYSYVQYYKEREKMEHSAESSLYYEASKNLKEGVILAF